MTHSDVIDSLIATYRNLNLKIRPLGASAGDGTTLLDTMTSLRESEIRASQTIKLMTLGESAIARASLESAPSANPNSVRTLLSEFGTAREAILATVREMSEEDLTANHPGFEGVSTIRQVLEQLIERDKKLMQSI